MFHEQDVAVIVLIERGPAGVILRVVCQAPRIAAPGQRAGARRRIASAKEDRDELAYGWIERGGEGRLLASHPHPGCRATLDKHRVAAQKGPKASVGLNGRSCWAILWPGPIPARAGEEVRERDDPLPRAPPGRLGVGRMEQS